VSDLEDLEAESDENNTYRDNENKWTKDVIVLNETDAEEEEELSQ